jgi:hypothetical protein
MLGATSALLAAALYIAPLRALFRFAPVAPPILAGAFAIGVVVMVVLAVSKRVRPLR